MADLELNNRPSLVTVTVGDRVTVHLAENASTGYRWSARVTDDAVVLESSEPIGGAGARPGAAGQRVIVLRAEHPGRVRVEFALVRSWEPDAPVDAWQLEVCVARPDPEARPGDDIS